MLIRDVMTRDVVTARPETSVPDLVEQMFVKGVSGIPVIDEHRRVLGVVSETDLIAREGVGRPRRRLLSAVDELLGAQRNRWWVKAHGLTAGELMTTPAHLARPEEKVRPVAARLVALGIKRMPVVDGDGRCVGIVSQRDLLRLLHRSDEELSGSIRIVLDDPLRCPERHGVTASVVQGVVALGGWAETSADRDLIRAMVGDVPGVLEVESTVVVGAPDPVTAPTSSGGRTIG